MKNFKSLLSNQSGMSLVEVMVAAAVSIVISMGIVKINESGQKAITKVSTDIDLNMWKTGVLYPELGNQDTCTLNFQNRVVSSNLTLGTDPAPAPTNVIYRGLRSSSYPIVTELLDGEAGRTERPLIQVGTSIGQGDTWEIVSARMLTFVSSDPGGNSPRGTCRVEIVLDRKRKASGSQNKTVFAPLDCTVDDGAAAVKRLTQCVLNGGAMESKWADESGSGLDWIVHTGEVVVGPTSTVPSANFTVDATNAPAYPTGATTTPNVHYGLEIVSSGTEEGALVFTQNKGPGEKSLGIYPDGNCISMGDILSGNLEERSKFCGMEASIASTANVNYSGAEKIALNAIGGAMSSGGRYHSLLSTRDSSITSSGDFINLTNSQDSNITGTGGMSFITSSIRSNISAASFNSVVSSTDSEITGGSFSTILGGSSVSTRSSFTTMAGANLTADSGAMHNVALGNHIYNSANETFTIGFNTSAQRLTNNVRDSFLASFENGYIFRTKRMNLAASDTSATAESGTVKINQDGSLLVNYLGATTAKLHVDGQAIITGGVYSSSDKRLKKNIKNIDSALDKVSKLNGVFFEWKSNDELEMGFIAQDVEKVFPEVVKTNKDGYKSINYANMTAALVESVKELKSKNEKLEKKVDLLMNLYCEDHREIELCN